MHEKVAIALVCNLSVDAQEVMGSMEGSPARCPWPQGSTPSRSIMSRYMYSGASIGVQLTGN